MQKFGKEKTGPGNDMSSTKGQLWSCREEGKSCTPQGDGWATCFSGSQKPSTLKSVQYEHYRDANPSLPHFKQKFWSSGLLLCHTEWRQSPAPKLNSPSEDKPDFSLRFVTVLYPQQGRVGGWTLRCSDLLWAGGGRQRRATKEVLMGNCH